MKRVSLKLVAGVFVGLLLGASSRAQAADPFPVEPYPFPYRSVAADGDVSAVRFNPASLSLRQEVEFSYFHKFSENPTGFNSVMMRAKAVGASVSWLDDAVHGKRREYLISYGKNASKGISVGATFRWLKADDTLLQNRTLWTFAAVMAPAPAWSAGARWENALHTKVGDTQTDGTWIFGFRSSPFRTLTAFTLDWIYPEWASPADTDLRFGALIHPTAGLNIQGYIGTDERVGIELAFMVERSKGGVEARMRDFTEYKDGTFYTSVLDHEYPQGKQGAGDE